jgi:hypothetical protein
MSRIFSRPFTQVSHVLAWGGKQAIERTVLFSLHTRRSEVEKLSIFKHDILRLN